MDDSVTQAVHDYLTQAPTSQFVHKEVAIVAQWEGQDNLLWRVQADGNDAVLKLYLDAGQARSRRQHDGQETFAPLGLAPRPLWYDRYPQGLARQVLIYEWIPGERLDLSDPGQRLALATAIGHIHQADPADVGRLSPNPVNLDYFWQVLQGSFHPIQAWLASRAAPDLAAIVRRLQKRAEAVAEQALPQWGETPPAPIHGDLKGENCLDAQGRVILLDWEMFGLGDPAQEVARFLLFSQQEMDGQQQTEWLDAYRAGVRQPGLAERIDVYRRLLPFHSFCFLLHGLQRELAVDPAQAEELAGKRRFLTETIVATLAQAADELLGDGQKGAIDAPYLLPEIERLLAPSQ